MRCYNFSPGPSMLPESVLKKAERELLEWKNGASALEVSHRSPEFQELIEKSKQALIRLMAIPDNYEILFLQGGATGQFAAVPMNLLRGGQTVDYVNTGLWSQKAIAEAGAYAEVRIAASAEENGFTSIPKMNTWKLNEKAAYLHYTPNETVHGLEFYWTPEVEVPLVADMSSNILSRPIDVSQFGLIYAGAQKNMGPAGLTVVIVRKDLMGNALPITPSVFDYSLQAKANSCYNTLPTFTLYMIHLMLEWLEAEGGVAAIMERNEAKAKLLYDVIDSSDFYLNKIAYESRSLMNVVFDFAKPELLEVFLRNAEAVGLYNLKGHRALGGVRASIYNAMPMSGVRTLAEFMTEFQAKYG